jgi:cyclin B
MMMQAPSPDFSVTPDMRRILLRWLLQVGKKFQIKHETMHICVQMIDFVLVFESHRINKANFQLLGVTSLFVASKYNEIHTWEAEKYVFVCDGLYSVDQLFEMEGLILLATSFNLQFPTIHQFAGLALEQHG